MLLLNYCFFLIIASFLRALEGVAEYVFTVLLEAGGERVREGTVLAAAPPPPPRAGPALSGQGLGLPLALDEDAMVGGGHGGDVLVPATPTPITPTNHPTGRIQTIPTTPTPTPTTTTTTTTIASPSSSSLAQVLAAVGALIDYLITHSAHKHATVQG